MSSGDEPAEANDGPDSDEVQPQPEDWTYLGPHQTRAATFMWRDAGGQILLFKQRARIFAGLYQVRVSRSGEGTTMYGDPQYTGRQADDATPIEVQALATEARLRVKRLEANTSRTATIDAALVPLLDVAASLTSMQDRRALLEYVTARIYRA